MEKMLQLLHSDGLGAAARKGRDQARAAREVERCNDNELEAQQRQPITRQRSRAGDSDAGSNKRLGCWRVGIAAGNAHGGARWCVEDGILRANVAATGVLSPTMATRPVKW